MCKTLQKFRILPVCLNKFNVLTPSKFVLQSKVVQIRMVLGINEIYENTSDAGGNEVLHMQRHKHCFLDIYDDGLYNLLFLFHFLFLINLLQIKNIKRS